MLLNVPRGSQQHFGSSRASPSTSLCTSCLSVWSTFHHRSSCLLALEDEVLLARLPGHVPQAQEIGIHCRLPPHFHTWSMSIGHILGMRDTQQVNSHFLCTWKSSCQSFVQYFQSPANPWWSLYRSTSCPISGPQGLPSPGKAGWWWQ